MVPLGVGAVEKVQGDGDVATDVHRLQNEGEVRGSGSSRGGHDGHVGRGRRSIRERDGVKTPPAPCTEERGETTSCRPWRRKRDRRPERRKWPGRGNLIPCLRGELTTL